MMQMSYDADVDLLMSSYILAWPLVFPSTNWSDE
jgi:hypothetical protein